MATAFEKADAGSPIYPSETCPDINRVQETVDKATKAIEECRNMLEEHSNNLDNLTGRRSELEDLRTQNSELRDSAVYWREAAKDMSDTITRLEKQVEDLETTVAEKMLEESVNGQG